MPIRRKARILSRRRDPARGFKPRLRACRSRRQNQNGGETPARPRLAHHFAGVVPAGLLSMAIGLLLMSFAATPPGALMVTSPSGAGCQRAGDQK